MNNLLIGSLTITLGGTRVLAGASSPMEQSPGVPTPPALVHKENAEANNGAGPNSSARVTEQKSVGGVPLQSLQPTAGRADAFLYFMKARLLKSTLAPASSN